MTKGLFYLLTFSILFFACTPPMEPRILSSKSDYGMIHYAEKSEALLILFPGFGGNAESIEREFNIIEAANKQGIDVLMMNFNQHLSVSAEELNVLTAQITDELVRTKEGIPLFIGGYSSGGNVSFLLADHLLSDPQLPQPTGVFCVDSPLDLHALYKSAQRTIARDFSEPAMQEAHMIVDLFETNFGTPEDSLFRYENAAVYTDSTRNLQNGSHLNKLKVRLYTEPDTSWWMENRRASYADMNASFLEAFAQKLQQIEGANVEVIRTRNKGYRADGKRHPHSWSIVDEKKLFEWVLGDVRKD